MPTRTRNDTFRTLDFPDAFEDLTGVIGSDLKVIVKVLIQRKRTDAALASTDPAAPVHALEQVDRGSERDDGPAPRRTALNTRS